ncbi:hypothetical protein EJ05DRAFT_479071 [Pseudovirgaria hyperparasitica]|uniref:Uncharacterized protein n=1 Tax=Pseudovirgaria hyperparasitica TaxID=470096 RepID=A0A6A6VZH1_9PEZI|nr:uncharacterized protein EJ05DRAFT_479071 [Pseudovirgaria hyperparasitica]KAF2755279.1 hypothetical protein EJ05DRAFT_479071 [Pseudovirgaria hyperparasitica]
MSDIKNQIANFGPKNEELLATLSKTDYAPASLKQQALYIKDLESQLEKTKKDYQHYQWKTRIEKGEFGKYRDSTMKRFMHKMGGSKGKEKFASKTEKEEKEYYEALQAERQSKDSLESIESALGEARPVKDQYQRDANANAAAQQELDNLYHMIFAGPTPAFPEEDQKEWPYSQAREAFNTAEQHYQAIVQASHCLSDANKRCMRAKAHIEDALDASRLDMFGGGMMADMAERDALSKAQSEASQLQSAVDQARRMYPELQPIGPVSIAQGNMMSDVLFDNIFSDMAFHDKIKDSAAQLNNVARTLMQRADQVKAEERRQKGELDGLAQRLGSARRDLQLARQAIFEKVGSEQQLPPAYTATAAAGSF